MFSDCPDVVSSEILFYKLSLDGQSRYFTVDNRTALCNVTLDTGSTPTQSNYDLVNLLDLRASFYSLYT